MAHYDLEEQEQIDSLKAWWKQYGNLITGLVMAASLAVIGWQGWNWYQRSQSAQAAAVFAVLEQAQAAGDAQKMKAATGELTEKFGRTSYASLAALLAARQSIDSGDAKTARVQLTWVVDNARDELRDVARLRLASLLLDDKAYDEALKQLEAGRAPAFDAAYLALKGDVLVAQSKPKEALAAYQAAKGKLAGKGNFLGEVLQQKIDNLGEAS